MQHCYWVWIWTRSIKSFQNGSHFLHQLLKQFLDDYSWMQCWNNLQICIQVETNTVKVKFVLYELDWFNRFKMVAIWNNSWFSAWVFYCIKQIIIHNLCWCKQYEGKVHFWEQFSKSLQIGNRINYIIFFSRFCV